MISGDDERLKDLGYEAERAKLEQRIWDIRLHLGVLSPGRPKGRLKAVEAARDARTTHT
jgi:hypothetical protein